jgi:hypothetical protein
MSFGQKCDSGKTFALGHTMIFAIGRVPVTILSKEVRGNRNAPKMRAIENIPILLLRMVTETRPMAKIMVWPRATLLPDLLRTHVSS